MKAIMTMALTTVIGLSANAATKATKKIDISTAAPEVTLNLQAEKYHTESSSEYVSKTCSREVPNGSSYECHSVPSYDCHEDRDCQIVDSCDANGCQPTRECSTHTECGYGGSTQECGYETSYTTETYDCSGYETQSWTVKDHDTKANIKIVLKDLPQGLTFKESIEVELNNDQVFVSAPSPKAKVLLFASTISHDNVVGGVNSLEAQVEISVVDAAQYIDNLSIEPRARDFQNGVGVIEFGAAINPDWYKLQLRLVKPRFLASAKEIAKVDLTLKDVEIDQTGRLVQVDLLKQLGVDWATLDKGSYRLETTLIGILDTSKAVNPRVLPKDLRITGKSKLKKP